MDVENDFNGADLFGGKFLRYEESNSSSSWCFAFEEKNPGKQTESKFDSKLWFWLWEKIRENKRRLTGYVFPDFFCQGQNYNFESR